MKQGTHGSIRRSVPVDFDRLIAEIREASVIARRTVSGDVEWTATQFRDFMNATRGLCDWADLLVLRVSQIAHETGEQK